MVLGQGKDTYFSWGVVTICSGGVAALGSKVGPERDNPLSEEKITIRHVGFDLITCWINAQLPSPLLGSLRTQK